MLYLHRRCRSQTIQLRDARRREYMAHWAGWLQKCLPSSRQVKHLVCAYLPYSVHPVIKYSTHDSWVHPAPNMKPRPKCQIGNNKTPPPVTADPPHRWPRPRVASGGMPRRPPRRRSHPAALGIGQRRTGCRAPRGGIERANVAGRARQTEACGERPETRP